MYIEKSIDCVRNIEKLINENLNSYIAKRFKKEGYSVQVTTVSNDMHEVLYYVFKFYKHYTFILDNYYLFTITIDNKEILNFVNEKSQYPDRNNIIEMILFEKLKLKEITTSGVVEDEYEYLLAKYK